MSDLPCAAGGLGYRMLYLGRQTRRVVCVHLQIPVEAVQAHIAKTYNYGHCSTPGCEVLADHMLNATSNPDLALPPRSEVSASQRVIPAAEAAAAHHQKATAGSP